MLDSKYRSLKDFVARKGGLRLAMHGGLRDQLVELAVAEFPYDAPEDRMVEVLAARLKQRCRKQYGSIMGMILIGVIVNLLSQLIVEWWRKNHSHKVLMYGWQRSAGSE